MNLQKKSIEKSSNGTGSFQCLLAINQYDGNKQIIDFFDEPQKKFLNGRQKKITIRKASFFPPSFLLFVTKA